MPTSYGRAVLVLGHDMNNRIQTTVCDTDVWREDGQPRPRPQPLPGVGEGTGGAIGLPEKIPGADIPRKLFS